MENQESENDRLFREFVEKVDAKISELNAKNETHKCWVCDEDTTTWGIMIPDKGRDGLGLGASRDEKKTRIVFFPVCMVHNLMTKESAEAVNLKLQVQRMIMSN